MALYGHINEFNQTEENINDYLDRLDFYLEANNVSASEKKRAILLSVVGPQQFRLLKDLAAPSKPAEKSFQELCKLLKDHHAPSPPKFLSRAKFDARKRQPGESIANFVAALRHLSEHCEFGETLNDRLCEKFVTGLNNSDIQRKLILERDLTIDKAIHLAASMERSHEAAKAMGPPALNAVDHRSRHNQSNYKNQRQTKTNAHGNNNKCHQCNGPHAKHQCKFKTAPCYKCGKQGHIAKACLSKTSAASSSPQRGSSRRQNQSHHQRQHFIDTPVQAPSSDALPEFNLFSISLSNPTPINVQMTVNGKNIEFQLDTGAALTVMTEKDFHAATDGTVPLQPCQKQLQTYTGESVPVAGECDISVGYRGQQRQPTLIVVKGGGPPLLGRNWLEHIKLDWQDIFTIHGKSNPEPTKVELRSLIEDNSSAFGNNGFLNDRTVKISVKDTNPKYCKASIPPYAMREKIENELGRLESNDIIKKVEHSDWATLIVPVLKKDGSVRICGDYKITVNKEIEQNRYPIPNIEDISLKLAGGEKFTELDFSHAYTQLGLHPDSKKYTTINTHKGLYQYERLCFGISSSPGIFQAVMDSIFSDVPNVCVYFDNLYITGKDDTEHFQTLQWVLKVIGDKGLKVNKDKCQFMLEEINFLGYKLNKQGIRPQDKKNKGKQRQSKTPPVLRILSN